LFGFNPRPPLLAGEPIAPLPLRPHPESFNPRPPLLAGEPHIQRINTCHTGVSIRARHCWRASPWY